MRRKGACWTPALIPTSRERWCGRCSSTSSEVCTLPPAIMATSTEAICHCALHLIAKYMHITTVATFYQPLGWFPATKTDIGWFPATKNNMGWFLATKNDIGWFWATKTDIGWFRTTKTDIGWFRAKNTVVGWLRATNTEAGWFQASRSSNFSCQWLTNNNNNKNFNWYQKPESQDPNNATITNPGKYLKPN